MSGSYLQKLTLLTAYGYFLLTAKQPGEPGDEASAVGALKMEEKGKSATPDNNGKQPGQFGFAVMLTKHGSSPSSATGQPYHLEDRTVALGVPVDALPVAVVAKKIAEVLGEDRAAFEKLLQEACGGDFITRDEWECHPFLPSSSPEVKKRVDEMFRPSKTDVADFEQFLKNTNLGDMAEVTRQQCGEGKRWASFPTSVMKEIEQQWRGEHFRPSATKLTTTQQKDALAWFKQQTPQAVKDIMAAIVLTMFSDCELRSLVTELFGKIKKMESTDVFFKVLQTVGSDLALRALACRMRPSPTAKPGDDNSVITKAMKTISPALNDLLQKIHEKLDKRENLEKQKKKQPEEDSESPPNTKDWPEKQKKVFALLKDIREIAAKKTTADQMNQRLLTHITNICDKRLWIVRLQALVELEENNGVRKSGLEGMLNVAQQEEKLSTKLFHADNYVRGIKEKEIKRHMKINLCLLVAAGLVGVVMSVLCWGLDFGSVPLATVGVWLSGAVALWSGFFYVDSFITLRDGRGKLLGDVKDLLELKRDDAKALLEDLI